MIQQTIIKQRFFFFVADESDISYNFSTRKQNAQLEKEETKAKFLVELLDKRGYEMSDIRLDFEGPKYEILGLTDLAAFRDGNPFLIAQFLKNEPSLTEIALSREALHEKMKDLEAQYGVLAWANKREALSLANGKINKATI